MTTIEQYLFIGVVADQHLVVGKLFEWADFSEWSCQHVDSGYTENYCSKCGVLVEKQTGQRRRVRPHFQQDKYNDGRFHYGKHCQIRLLQSGEALIFTGNYCHDCYGDGCPEKIMSPIQLPNDEQLAELTDLLAILEVPGRIQIHYISD